jgi:hypothetical protein
MIAPASTSLTRKKSISLDVQVRLPGEKTVARRVVAHSDMLTSLGVALKSAARMKGMSPWSVSAISSLKSSLASGDFKPSLT